MRDIWFTSSDSGWAIGGISSTAVISRTTNGGTTWIISNGHSSSLAEIAMTDSRTGWIVGRLYSPTPRLTTDGGLTWSVQTLVPNPADVPDIRSISMVNDKLGWIVESRTGIYKTTNGGVTSATNGPNMPEAMVLEQNYPNPFNPGTVIKFQIPQSGFVSLKIFDIAGKEVATLIEETLSAGDHSIEWKPESAASGVYFYQMRSGGTIATRKLMLLK